MEKEKSIQKNMIMSIILTASNFIFPLITYSYVARVLSPIGTGKVAFVNSILTYFSYIAILGIPPYGIRECAKVRDNRKQLSKVVQELLIINLISTFIAYILLFLAVLFIPKLYQHKKIFAVMSAYIFLNTIGLEWVYKAKEEYSYITKRSLFFKSISVVLTFFFIRSSEDYLWYGFLTIFTTSASYICNFFNIRKFISFHKEEKYDLKRHIKPIYTLFFASIIVTIYANFDISMIGFIMTEDEVGLYNAALKIKSIILAVSTAVTSVLIPRMAYYYNDGKLSKTHDLVEQSMRVSLLLAIPIAVYVFVFPEETLWFVCGNEYLGAVNTLRVLSLCIVPLIVTNILGNQILIPFGRENVYSQSVFVGLWINLILNILMIPVLGAFGAAIGTFVTECWNVLWMGRGAKEYVITLTKRINYLPFVAAILVSLFVAKYLVMLLNYQIRLLRLILSGMAFIVCYYLILYLLKEPMLVRTISSFTKRIKNRGR